MGMACGCQHQYIDGSNVFEGLMIRKLYFREYIKIFEDNRSNWLKKFEFERKNENSFDIKKFKLLGDLLDSPNFSDHQREFFLSKINIFLSKIPDALIFFTSLSFFTKLENVTKRKKNFLSRKITLNNILEEKVEDEYDFIRDNLLKLSIKQHDHDVVTKLFIEFVSEFTIDFIYSEEDTIEKNEKKKKFSRENREKLFNWLKKMNNENLYLYLFDSKNVKKISQDLERLYENENINDNNSNFKDKKDLSYLTKLSKKNSNIITSRQRNIVK